MNLHEGISHREDSLLVHSFAFVKIRILHIKSQPKSSVKTGLNKDTLSRPIQRRTRDYNFKRVPLDHHIVFKTLRRALSVNN